MKLFTLISLLALISCTRKTEETALTQALSQPREGGNIIVGRPSDSVGLDPAFETDGESFSVTENIFDRLVMFKNDSTEIIPGLATAWEISPDNLKYTFTLREGVKFHSGKELTADDVVATFERQMDKNHPLAKFGGVFKYWEAMEMNSIVQSIKADGKFKVIFTLKHPEAPFLSNLAMSFAGIINADKVKEFGKQHSFQPDGTGPFMFESWDRNSQIVLKKNPQFWGGKVYADKLIFRVIPENTSRTLELKQANIHVMDAPSVEDMMVLDRLPHINILKTPGINVLYLALNMEKKPLMDLNLRLAINHAINKERIIQLAFGGNALPAKNPIPPSIWGYNDSIQPYPYDVEKAKKYLSETSFKGELKFFVMPPRPYNPNSDKVAVLIQEDLRQIGLNVKIEKYEWASHLDKTSNGEHDICTLGWIGDNGDPDNFLYVLLGKQATKKPAQNLSFYKNDNLQKILIDAKKETLVENRKKLYMQAQEIIHQDAPWVPLVHTMDFSPHLKIVRDFYKPPIGQTIYAKVWLQQ